MSRHHGGAGRQPGTATRRAGPAGPSEPGVECLFGDAALARSGEIARLLHAAFDAAGQRWSPESVRETLAGPGARALLCREGCAIVRTVADEAEILTLAVAPSARRRGTGSALVRACIAEGERAGAVALHLEVAEGNAAAVGLYAASGFAETGRRRGYYRLGVERQDAILMSRPLGPDR